MRKYLPLFLLLAISCNIDKNSHKQLLFNKISSSRSGIHFANELSLDKDFDVFRYRNYYNGGGAAIGDINNDGLEDIYLTANARKNNLYLNKGNFKFEDITTSAGVSGTKSWSTGVCMADVNGDGFLDIYVCNSGDFKDKHRENELFINNGDLTFTESAKKYGLDDNSFSTAAVFFDYDQDGDLDCYVLNNSFRPVSTLGLENIRNVRDSTGGDKLFQNTNNKFIDVSGKAGIYGSVIGFGLGVTVTDVNQDHWMDLYVSNDFFERDYLYMNNKDGTFSESLPKFFDHISESSMGADAADINNDGYPDIFGTDMLPESDYRLKTITYFESYGLQQLKLANDYYYQYMRNMLQINNGNGSFTEIGQYSGVNASDWSWGTFIADFDNDTNKEIYITNGIYRDVINQDFIAYLVKEKDLVLAMRHETVDFQKLVEKMPSTKLSNYLFKRDTTGLKFRNVAAEWGLDLPSFSNGAAYGDLDNDGDLDIVVNNVNQELFVYQNETEDLLNKNYLRVSFSGPDRNKFGIGASVKGYKKNKVIMLENVPNRGFQSSMGYTMVMGLDTIHSLDSLVVHWGYGKKQTLENVKANQQLTLNIHDAVNEDTIQKTNQPTLFKRKMHGINPVFRHVEDNFVDFSREPLIYHMMSREGPALAVGDVNKDGLDDFFIGGAHGSPGALYLQDKNGNFNATEQKAFERDKMYEDVDAVFFDADGDGSLELYVVSGGYAFRENSREYQDRLYTVSGYIGGTPTYKRTTGDLQAIAEDGSCVRAADFDRDGDIDLFVGSRAVAGKYGLSASSHLLQNDGKGKFLDVTSRVAPQLFDLGMVTDAQWVDYDNDKDLDLVVVGEWMPIVLFKNNGTNLERLNNIPGLTKSNGWWNSIEVSDINDDGNVDFIAGNWGLNTKFTASAERPIKLFISDFDHSGTLDPIFAYYEGDKLYPMALRHNIIEQLPYLKKQFVSYEDYAGKTIDQIFTTDQLAQAYIDNAYKLESVVVINNGDGSYEIKPLPAEAQFSPIFTTVVEDFDNDSVPDIFMAGNFSGVKPEEGKYDANHGLLMYHKGSVFKTVPFSKSGIYIRGEVRKAKVAKGKNGRKFLILAKNNDEMEIYEDLQASGNSGHGN